MTDISPQLSSAEWAAYMRRMEEKIHTADRLLREKHGEDVRGFDDEWQRIVYGHRDTISLYFREKGNIHESNRYAAFHALIGSTTDRENSPVFDLPGELNIEKFLDDVIAGTMTPERVGQIRRNMIGTLEHA